MHAAATRSEDVAQDSLSRKRSRRSAGCARRSSCTLPTDGFCKLDLDDRVPYHSTFSINAIVMHRQSSDDDHALSRFDPQAAH
jgi:hypothetical protein